LTRTYVTPLARPLYRERMIIGSVAYRNRYWVYCIELYRLLLYRPILRASLQVHQLLKGRITHDNQRTFAPVTCCVRGAPFDPQYGRGLEGREEGDCNLKPASPWHLDSAVLGVGHQQMLTPYTSTSRKW